METVKITAQDWFSKDTTEQQRYEFIKDKLVNIQTIDKFDAAHTPFDGFDS